MNVVIIEDEPLMASALQETLEELGRGIIVKACLSSVKNALQYFDTHDLPQLFFSDIQLPDGLSFEIFRQLKTKVPVIFCTAYDEYALEAFKLNGIDYILKPFDTPALEATIDKYFSLTQTNTSPVFDAEQLMMYFGIHQKPQSNNLLVYQGEKIIPLKKQHIAVIYIKNSIVYTHTFDQKKYVLDQNLDDLEKDLGNDFFRANRQCIIHREAIKEVVRYFARKLLIQLNITYSDPIIISKVKAPIFINWLQGR